MERPPLDGSERFAIVVAEWNRSITAKLLQGALSTLVGAGVSESQIDVVWVPGAWEIPVVAQRFAQSESCSAVICLGAVIRGETSHDQHINRAVSLSLQQISLANDLPMLFGLLTCETMEQAIHRSGGNVGNKGIECAEAALAMVALLKNCPPA
ncbi:6,7-dimethyl-8-ribityllumazine synthase [Bythopirellula polymerisocia]|uniref:6,7-dimethyl-8-ribityllumazine synthase n=1 Tax=Bythopirellula polymerisocia TaxID=2528003 RepID=A0A5C6CV05_9BACT|nr:6,7-dimethyl-8-ribityllumazine synthase [Bythopirellula polymerisocia]TWU27337.1 6,7-dimethyl-8-ribityllumazine synthase [Bythopirellula polymerisocia]